MRGRDTECQLGSAHVCKHKVGHKDVDIFLVPLCFQDGFFAVPGGNHIETRCSEKVDSRFADKRFVFDHQNGRGEIFDLLVGLRKRPQARCMGPLDSRRIGMERCGVADDGRPGRIFTSRKSVHQCRSALGRAPDILQIPPRGMLVRKRLTGKVRVRDNHQQHIPQVVDHSAKFCTGFIPA